MNIIRLQESSNTTKENNEIDQLRDQTSRAIFENITQNNKLDENNEAINEKTTAIKNIIILMVKQKIFPVGIHANITKRMGPKAIVKSLDKVIDALTTHATNHGIAAHDIQNIIQESAITKETKTQTLQDTVDAQNQYINDTKEILADTLRGSIFSMRGHRVKAVENMKQQSEKYPENVLAYALSISQNKGWIDDKLITPREKKMIARNVLWQGFHAGNIDKKVQQVIENLQITEKDKSKTKLRKIALIEHIEDAYHTYKAKITKQQAPDFKTAKGGAYGGQRITSQAA